MKKLLMFISVLIFIGCTSKPSETDCRQVANNLINQNDIQNYIQVVDVTKANAFDGKDPYNGQNFYVIQTTVTIRILNECEWYPDLKFNVFTAKEVFFKKYYRPVEAGFIGRFKHNFVFYDTEKGWEGPDKHLY
jgi:hypothetical protein